LFIHLAIFSSIGELHLLLDDVRFAKDPYEEHLFLDGPLSNLSVSSLRIRGDGNYRTATKDIIPWFLPSAQSISSLDLDLSYDTSTERSPFTICRAFLEAGGHNLVHLLIDLTIMEQLLDSGDTIDSTPWGQFSIKACAGLLSLHVEVLLCDSTRDGVWSCVLDIFLRHRALLSVN